MHPFATELAVFFNVEKCKYHEAQSTALQDCPNNGTALTQAILTAAAESGRAKSREVKRSQDDKIKQLRKERDEATTKGERRLKTIRLNRELRQRAREKQNKRMDELIERGAANKLPQVQKYFKKRQAHCWHQRQHWSDAN